MRLGVQLRYLIEKVSLYSFLTQIIYERKVTKVSFTDVGKHIFDIDRDMHFVYFIGGSTL